MIPHYSSTCEFLSFHATTPGDALRAAANFIDSPDFKGELDVFTLSKGSEDDDLFIASFINRWKEGTEFFDKKA